MDLEGNKVCIRCITYNQSSYIEDAMRGFVMQETDFPFVAVIVDDCSTDGEQGVIRAFLEKEFDMSSAQTEETEDANVIRVRHKTNKNCSFVVCFLKYNHYQIRKSKNVYFEKYAPGVEYIALCEGDDYWIDAHKLKRQVDFLDSNCNVGLVYSKAKIYFEERQEFGEPVGCSYDSMEELLLANRIPTLTTCFRKELYDKFSSEISSWPESKTWKMGDYPLWLMFSYYSDVVFSEDVTSVYRFLPESMSHSKDIEKSIAFRKSAEDIQLFYASRFLKSDNEVVLKIKENTVKEISRLCFGDGKRKQLKNFLKSQETLSAKSKRHLLICKCPLFFCIYRIVFYNW